MYLIFKHIVLSKGKQVTYIFQVMTSVEGFKYQIFHSFQASVQLDHNSEGLSLCCGPHQKNDGGELEILLKSIVGHIVDRAEGLHRQILRYSLILVLAPQFSISSFEIIVFGDWVTSTNVTNALYITQIT